MKRELVIQPLSTKLLYVDRILKYLLREKRPVIVYGFTSLYTTIFKDNGLTVFEESVYAMGFYPPSAIHILPLTEKFVEPSLIQRCRERGVMLLADNAEGLAVPAEKSDREYNKSIGRHDKYMQERSAVFYSKLTAKITIDSDELSLKAEEGGFQFKYQRTSFATDTLEDDCLDRAVEMIVEHVALHTVQLMRPITELALKIPKPVLEEAAAMKSIVPQVARRDDEIAASMIEPSESLGQYTTWKRMHQYKHQLLNLQTCLIFCLKKETLCIDVIPIIMEKWLQLEESNGINQIYYGGDVSDDGPRPGRVRKEHNRQAALRKQYARWATFGPEPIKLLKRTGMGPIMETAGLVGRDDALFFAVQFTDRYSSSEFEVRFTVNIPGCLKNPKLYYKEVVVMYKAASKSRFENSMISYLRRGGWRFFQFEIDRQYSYYDLVWITILRKGKLYGTRPLLRSARETSVLWGWEDEETDIAKIENGLLKVCDSPLMTKHDVIQLFLQ
jgi:hypothetical protein